jgi:hypothetical protein
MDTAPLEMDDSPHNISACRRCFHYHSEGRRGGYCQLLGVPVQGAWDACSMARPQFLSVSVTTALEDAEPVMQRSPLAIPEPQPVALLLEMFVAKEEPVEQEPVPVAIPLELPQPF